MVLIKEYRIPMPFTMEEYSRGLLYAIAKASSAESVSGVPMKIIKCHEEFTNVDGMEKGIFNHRIIYLTGRLPDWGRKLINKSGAALQIEEKSWNAFPYIKTVYTCPLFSEDKFKITVETRHAEDYGQTDNILKLPRNVLRERTVDYIDIAMDQVDARYFKKEEDPRQYVSKLTGRGQLKQGWQYTTKPVICAYKLVRVNFNYWGLRTKLERLIQDVIRGIYLTTHRQQFCWMDEWYKMSLGDIFAYEEKLKESMNKISENADETQQLLLTDKDDNNNNNNNNDPSPSWTPPSPSSPSSSSSSSSSSPSPNKSPLSLNRLQPKKNIARWNPLAPRAKL